MWVSLVSHFGHRVILYYSFYDIMKKYQHVEYIFYYIMKKAQ